MAIMTAQQYQERKAALVTGIALAGGEFQSAALKEQTGAGSAAQVKKAEDHLAELRRELVRHEAAWVAAQAEASELRHLGRMDTYNAAVEAIETAIGEREQALRDVLASGDEVVAAILRYHEASIAIRSKAISVAGNVGAASENMRMQINGLIENNVAETAFSAMLNTARVSITTNAQTHDAFPGGDALAFEDRLAAKVRSTLRAIAPKAEAA